MGSHHHHDINLDERYDFSGEGKKRVLLGIGVGLLMFILGIVMLAMGVGEHHAAPAEGHHAAAEGGHHAFNWMSRVWANLWLNGVFFTGISVIGLFFVAFQYAAWAGWSAGLKRVPEAFASFLPVTFVVLLVTFLVGGHDLFHWTHHDLYEKFLADGKTPNPEYDAILDGKKGFLNTPFYLIRMVAFFGLWYLMFTLIRKESLKEDNAAKGDYSHYNKLITLSAVFLVIFAVSSSISAWDWVMSVDPHWFSTLFAWYMFASWFVSGLATITLATIFLKDRGYLRHINENHLHDLGKFMFAFSVFWTYLWFAQFLLIYYANIPEEAIYFIERRDGFDGHYTGLFFFNIVINFLFPFLTLMTRDAKRKMIFLKIVAVAILIGHWLDFYLMMMPGMLKEHSGFSFLEFGGVLFFASLFIYVISTTISKAPLVAKNHPMLEESIHLDT